MDLFIDGTAGDVEGAGSAPDDEGLLGGVVIPDYCEAVVGTASRTAFDGDARSRGRLARKRFKLGRSNTGKRLRGARAHTGDDDNVSEWASISQFF